MAVYFTPSGWRLGLDDVWSPAPEAFASLMVAETNGAFRRSGVRMQLDVVDMGRLSSDDFREHRSQLEELRDSVGADIVAVIYDQVEAACGFATGWIAYVHYSCGARTFAHEIGHTMGLDHDRFVDCPVGCPGEYNFGYVNQEAFKPGADRDSRWYTIMAFRDQCTLALGPTCDSVMYFSNPALMMHGDPMGVPLEDPSLGGMDGPADAVRHLNAVREAIAERNEHLDVPLGLAKRLWFEETSHEAVEGGDPAVVRVGVHPPLEVGTHIRLDIRPGAGVTDSDHSRIPNPLYLEAGRRFTNITVVALDDEDIEQPESVRIGLPAYGPFGGAQSAVVTLRDNDGANRPPVAVGGLAARTLRIAQGPEAVDVAGAFRDPDGDVLAYGARSSSTATVAVSASGSTATLTPLEAGAAVITVTATDAQGSNTTATQRFSVTVANQAPVALGALAAQTLRIDEGPVAVEVAEAFRDPDGDVLTYGAASSAAMIATVEVLGSTVAVTPLEAGAAVITVTATDADGTNTAATQRFDVTVANRAPVTVGRLADRAVRINEGPVVVDAADAFRDPDGDALAYRAASSAPTVATVEVSGSAVTVRPLEAGTAAVTVTATDPDGSRQTAMQAFTVAVLAPGTGDYDTDDDGLIEIRNLAQLDAMRHDLQAGGTASHPAHAAAFPHALPAMGCPEEGCTGYELVADLDFDTNANGVADAGDAYWNGGDGWRPIGSNDDPFTATFAGKGHTIAHLFIRSDLGSYYGLFGVAGASGVIRGVGLIDVDVTGSHDVGGLMGRNAGVVTASFVTGRVEAVSSFSRAGGLSGINSGRITASYAAVRVSARSRHARAGGLVGNNFNDGSITASYATGSVVAAGMDCVAGGLVGGNHRGASVAASYATGRVTVSDGGAAGGLVGDNWGTGHVSASYWDTLTSARATGGSGSGQSTSALQTPIGYAGLYQDWDVDVDGDAGADAPWEFGTASQYPALAVDFDGDEQATWQEFGYQAREGPMLTAPSSVDGSRVDLSWTAVDVTHWTPAPVVAYAVYRIEGGHATLHADDVRGLDFVDHFVEVDSTYGYQAAALVADGESSRSTAAPVTTPAQFTTNRGPVAVGTLTPLTLRIVDGTVSVEVADAFRDPDDDALTYAAFSSAPAVVRVSVTGSTVTVTPVATGTATVTVTATDVSGSNASATRRSQ